MPKSSHLLFDDFGASFTIRIFDVLGKLLNDRVSQAHHTRLEKAFAGKHSAISQPAGYGKPIAYTFAASRLACATYHTDLDAAHREMHCSSTTGRPGV